MSDEIIIDGEQFVSSKRASELSGYKQDYIGQLSRGGQITARRVGGLWYVSSDSLTKYMKRAEAYKPVPPINNGWSDADALLSFDGRGYVSAARAAKLTGYSADYVGQMARAEIIPSRQVGNRWYVEQAGILAHKESKDALLAAVQAESVGIDRTHLSRQEEVLSGMSYGTAGPFLNYTNDGRELFPNLGNSARNNDPITSQDNRPIPIHIIDLKSDTFKERESWREDFTQGTVIKGGGMAIKSVPLVLSAMVMTIVIVVSLGFVSLKSSSTYTSNILERGSEGKNLIAGAAGAWVGRAADFLEPFLTSELIYIRDK
ncbi:MAG: hypothetical protein Q7S05_01735 [bacterium]|nr:hypothetical protein [bacterium]